MENLAPDDVLETFFNQIKKAIEEGRRYDHFTRSLKSVNGNIPENIQKLIDNHLATNNPTHDRMIELGFTFIPAILTSSYEISISNFDREYKVISVHTQPGNQYIYLRNGDKDKPREEDHLISIFNSDINGPLTVDKIKKIYNAITDKNL